MVLWSLSVPASTGRRRCRLRIDVRAVPWLLAVAGLVIPLIGSRFVIWPIVLAWLVAIGLIRLLAGAIVTSRFDRIVAGLLLLPVLFLLAFEGGWWLIPADLAWLVIEVACRRPDPIRIGAGSGSTREG